MATWTIRIEDKSYQVDVQSLDAGAATVVVDGRTYAVRWDEAGAQAPVVTRVAPVAVAAPSAPAPSAATAPQGVITSPLPGLVLELLVKVGDRVEPGQVVARIEAMKMANEVRTGVAGAVTELLVRAGDTVDEGAHLLRIG